METPDSLARAEERTVLEAIYGDEFDASTSPAQYTVNIPLKARKLRNLTVSFSLPQNYPSAASPAIAFVNPSNLPDDRKQRVTSALTDIWRTSRDCVLFRWIEWLRENAVQCLLDQADQQLLLTASDGEEESDGSEHEDEDRAGYNEMDSSVANRSGGKKATKAAVVVRPADYTGPPIAHGTAFTDRKSKFIAHLARVANEGEVKQVMDSINNNRKLSTATHNMWAVRLRTPEGLNELRDDDGEGGAGDKLLILLQQLNVEGVLVVVSRWFGGVMLGPDRFRHIVNVARELLLAQGFGKKNDAEEGDGGPKESKRLRPAEDVLHRVKWDPSIDKKEFVIGYEDRFEGIMELSFEEFDSQTDIPMHRVRYFKQGGVIVWDRRTKTDHFFKPPAPAKHE